MGTFIDFMFKLGVAPLAGLPKWYGAVAFFISFFTYLAHYNEFIVAPYGIYFLPLVAPLLPLIAIMSFLGLFFGAIVVIGRVVKAILAAVGWALSLGNVFTKKSAAEAAA